MTKDELREYLLQNQEAMTLDLSGKDIVELPSELWQLANLQALDLEGNKLTALPPEICRRRPEDAGIFEKSRELDL